LGIADKLHLDELAEKYIKITKQKGDWRANIERDLEACERYVGVQIDSTVEKMVARLIPQMKKHVFHLAWSPAACPVDQSLKPLTDMVSFFLQIKMLIFSWIPNCLWFISLCFIEISSE
jgi:hypothetical protein